MRLLHLEDSPNDAELIAGLIRAEWPECQIHRVAGQGEFMTAMAAGDFDLILSDYSMPDYDGLSALETAHRQYPDKPFIFLSGTIGEDRAVEALKRGATDYVIKDHPGRLVSAIRQAFALVEEAARRRRTEEALQQNEERFRQITENVADLIAVFDLEGRRLYQNPASRGILGELPASPNADSFRLVHPGDRARLRGAMGETVRTGTGQRLDYRFLLPDGRVRHIESHCSVIRDAAGRVANLLEVSRDVTERREADAQLQEQAALLDKARDAIIATDLDQRIAYWNTSAERLYGWSWKAGEVFGRKLEQLKLGYDPARFAAAREQVLATGEWRGEFRLQTKSGDFVQVESTWSLVVGADGAPRSILFIDTDVTEKNKLMTELLRSQRMESIGTLAGGVAHDLNNVLTPILMASQLLNLKLTNEADTRLVGRIESSAQHGAALVRQLLAFARGADGQRERVNAGQIITDLQEMIHQSLPAAIELKVESAGEPWPVVADATQLKQIILNLCINARDAMPRGGRITILLQNLMVGAELARLYPGAKPGPHLLIAVTDTGTGIPPAIIDRIFDPFFTTKAAGKGTGLGLSMVAGIIKSHGGFLKVDSEPERGTTFSLFLPALASALAAPPVEIRPELPRGRSECVLVIDDDPNVREVIRALLANAGYRVLVAGGGAEGIELYSQHRAEIAVVLTDLRMPDVDGPAVITAVRKLDPGKKIVAMSGWMEPGTLQGTSTGEPIECLPKPVTAAKLLARLRELIGAGPP